MHAKLVFGSILMEEVYMEAPTVHRGKIQVDVDGWLWKWYVWSLDIIYRFFDGHTLPPWEAEKKLGNLCSFVQTRTAALVVLALQAGAIGLLIWGLTWLPVQLFSFWGYMIGLRVITAVVLGFVAAVLLVIASVPSDYRGYDEKELRIKQVLGALACLAVGRILIGRIFGSGEATGWTNFILILLGTLSVISFLLLSLGLRRERRRHLRQSRHEESSETPPAPTAEEPKEKPLGFWQLAWLYAKAVKARICPVIEPVKNGRPTVKEAN